MTSSLLRLAVLFPLAALLANPAALPAQPAANPPQGVQAASDLTPLPSMTLAPAIAQLRQALATLRPEKWKTPGPVTQETAANLGSIERDLDNTLPGLLAAADRNPGSVADVLPAYRNVEALYDVLLRVMLVANLDAPDPQSAALQHATATLDDARRGLGDRLQSSAAAEGRAMATLRTQLRTAQSAPAPAAAVPVCTPPPATTKKRPASKPKPTPAAAPPTSSH